MRIGLGLSIVGQQVPSVTGILDTYSGAAAAYSVRRLSSSYSGSAVRVRESSGGTETDIGFDASGNLDETALLSHCGANDGFVTKWYDQSGNGNDAIQSTALSQPKIVSSGTVVKENGRPAMDFNSDYLQATSINESQPTTYFIVAKRDSLTGKQDYTDGATTRQEIALADADGTYDLFAGSPMSTSVPATTNQELNYVLFDGASSEIAVNSVDIAISGNPGANAINSLLIGADTDQSDYLDGKMQELILYNSDQSANRTGIEGNINGYFSIYP